MTGTGRAVLESGARAVSAAEPVPFPAAEWLDAVLGDPWRPSNPFGFAAGAARDLTDAYPARFADRLRWYDFHTAYLPASLGGTLRSLEGTQVLVRVAARRDVNVMPATMFSISSAMTALAIGSERCRTRIADWVRHGRTVAFALSEEASGSDVLSGACRLVPDGDGWRLHGTKWLVGRGATADAVLVVARTGERGPAAFTAVLLGPEQLADPRVRRHAPRPTTGMRGIDFADLTFNGCPVPRTALVGAEGEGLAGAMRAQQIVRLMSTAGALATADTALRTAVRFSAEHSTGRATLADTPWTARELALAAAELFAADLSALVASRYAHLAPGRFGLASSVVKRVVTRLTASAASRAAAVVGARAVLRHGRLAPLGKAVRDNAMVEVIDTSVMGNLRAVAMQLPGYAQAVEEAPRDEAAELFALGGGLPELDPAALDLGARPDDDVLLTLHALAPEIAGELRRRAAADPSAGPAATRVTELAARLTAVFDDAAVAQADRSRSLRAATDLVDLADRCCLLHAAATAALTWWFNQERGLYGAPPGSAGWLAAVLGLLLATEAGRDPRTAAAEIAPAGRLLTALTAAGRLYTALPVRLSDGVAHPGEPKDVT